MSIRRVEQAIEKLSELGAAKVDLIALDLAAHLKGTHQLLQSWGNREPICLAGLYHAVYGADDFPHMLAVLESRDRVRELIGDEVERLVYITAPVTAPLPIVRSFASPIRNTPIGLLVNS